MASKYTLGRMSDAQILKLAAGLFEAFSTGSYSITIGDIFYKSEASKKAVSQILSKKFSAYDFNTVSTRANH